jgi:putative flippase GtrA
MTAILSNPRERTRFLRFMVVGIIGAVIDFSSFNVLSGLLHLPGVISQALSFTIAVISNFLWNRYWTYPDSRTKTVSSQLIQFFVVNIIGLAIRTPIFVGLEKPFDKLFSYLLPSFSISASKFMNPQFVGHNMALATAIIVVMLWNFFINRYWTYNDVG